MGSLRHTSAATSQQILVPDAEQNAIPSLDGALSPNDALDALRADRRSLARPRRCRAEAPDGSLLVSAGRQVLQPLGRRLTTRAQSSQSSTATQAGLPSHPDGRLLVCVAGRGLAAVDAGEPADLAQSGRRTQPLDCLPVAVAPDGRHLCKRRQHAQCPRRLVARPDAEEQRRTDHRVRARLRAPRRSCFATCPIRTDWRSRRTDSSCGSPRAGAIASAAPPSRAGELGAVEPVIGNLPGYPGATGPRQRRRILAVDLRAAHASDRIRAERR